MDFQNKNSYDIIGVMSGTSLDGIDIAHIRLDYVDEKWSFEILVSETILYSKLWKQALQSAINHSETQLERLNFKYTEKLAQEIGDFISKYRIRELDAVCSHGHTILHRPDKGFTLQIGNLPKIASLLGQTVVCDFRTQDVELGGQGAPLVPIGDRLFFSELDYCLNLGGFANCSYENSLKRIAYDICPVNIVLNHYSELLGQNFDEGGRLAASGRIDENLLRQLNSIEYYSLQPPKSLGLEWVKANIFPLIATFEISAINILRTFVEHVAIQLVKQFSENSSVLITGGGTYNTLLMDRLKSLSQLQIVIPSSEIVEFKEALIFGLLGVLKLRGENNVLSSVTGAKKDHSSGTIYLI